MKLKVKRLNDIFEIKLEYKTNGSVGFDLPSTQKCCLAPGERRKIPCGFSIELPEGFAASVLPRSGISLRDGLVAITGTIDSDYRGEICAVLQNTDYKERFIVIGQRIAQLVVFPIVRCEFEYVDKLSFTKRDIYGFGSTGDF